MVPVQASLTFDGVVFQEMPRRLTSPLQQEFPSVLVLVQGTQASREAHRVRTCAVYNNIGRVVASKKQKVKSQDGDLWVTPSSTFTVNVHPIRKWASIIRLPRFQARPLAPLDPLDPLDPLAATRVV